METKLNSVIRRLTPVETTRLMGFQADDYLNIDPGKISDAPQYKACGNSWGVNSAEFVNTRIEKALRESGAVDVNRAISYATTCSGVEAHSQSVRNAAWNAKFFSEIEPFPCRVLATRFPHVPNLGDMTKIDAHQYNLDVFSGGTPCQSVSIAGKRHGMSENSGTRSSLAFHWLRIGKESNTKVMLWENVCGAYSANEGRDFAWFVHRITEAGYGVAWRTLDVQYDFSFMFPRAIPQRRRRIWLVAVKDGNWQMSAQIMFERSKYTGAKQPNRILGDGTFVAAEGSREGLQPHRFFSSESRADWIPISEFPKYFGDARKILAKCGEIRYSGKQFTFDLFSNGEQSPDNFETVYLENIGAGAGVACGDCATVLTMPEWTAGIQLPWGEKLAPDEFDGSVKGLSDLLLPWGDYLGKYLLSKRACEGIISRAAKRGKALPKILSDALDYQIGKWTQGFLDRYLVKEGLIDPAESESGADGEDTEVDE